MHNVFCLTNLQGVSTGCFVLSCFIIHTLRTNPYLDAILVTDDNNSKVKDAQFLIDNTTSTARFIIFLSVVTFIIELFIIIGLFFIDIRGTSNTLSGLRRAVSLYYNNIIV